MKKWMKMILPAALAVTIGTAALPAQEAQASIISSSGWEYYNLNGYADEGDSESGIYKENEATGEVVKLTDEWTTGDIYVTGDWVYYTVIAPLDFMGGDGMMPSYMMRIKKDGTGKEQISREKIYTMAVEGDWIVYSAYEGTDKYEGNKLMRMKADGTELSSFTEDSAILLAGKDGWIYYINAADEHLYRVKTDGTGKTRLADEYSNILYGTLQIEDDLLLYTGSKEKESGSSASYVIRLDGSGKIKISDEESFLESVDEEWIYYYDMDPESYDFIYTKIKRDGTGKTRLEEPAPVDPSTDPAAPAFTDVSGHWAENAIAWAKAWEISSGYPDGTFRPDSNVSEEEFLKMFLAAFGVEDELGDQAVRWSDAYYEFAAERNYPVLGDTSTDAKSRFITRQSVAEIMAKADGADVLGDQAVQYLLDMSYSSGKNGATVEGYAGQDTLTRAEAIQFIRNAIENGLEI
ncbi:DUF5050 domain-containing protein [Paenibacillus sp. FJAT-26967]|uniref:DUF5050 domain-containing protein n=1 Tax=Paenibacillus sp. FJAT-26967 TaxID=1729690 RepID=UPI0008384A4D|nr:DUF5050 domain-containing protein [Paenibacillus sp. FJAT-26967]